MGEEIENIVAKTKKTIDQTVEIIQFGKIKPPQVPIESFLPKKKLFLQALMKTMGIVTAAVRSLNETVNAYQHYKWMKQDENYRIWVEYIENIQLDFVESKLLEQIVNGDKACIMFYLKTKGKNRGWTERVELDIQTDNQNEIEEVFVFGGKEFKFGKTSNNV